MAEKYIHFKNGGQWGELYGRIRWSSISNGTAANSSQVTAALEVRKETGGGTTSGTWSGYLTIDGERRNFSQWAQVSNQWITLFSFTAAVLHRPDGSGTCYLSGKAGGPSGTTLGGYGVSGSESVTLEKIPRQATITSAPDFTDEDNPTISYLNPAGSAVEELMACISWTGGSDIYYRDVPVTGTSYTFSLTDEERSRIRRACTGNTMDVTFYLRTTIGSVYYFSTIVKKLTVINANPVLNVSAEDTNPITTALTGDPSSIISGYSNVLASLSAAAQKEATITDFGISIGAGWQKKDRIQFQNMKQNFVSFFAQDSRGNRTEKTISFQVIPYFPQSCGLAVETLLDESNSMTCRVNISGRFFKYPFGQKNNAVRVFYRVKPYGGSYGEPQEITHISYFRDSYTAEIPVTGLSADTSYIFQAYAVDVLETVYSTEYVAKSAPLFDTDGKKFRFYVPVGVPNHFSVAPETAGMYGQYGYVFSRQGNTYGRSINVDNYYLGIDSEGGLHVGLQLNGATEITWKTV